jgi:ubiquinone/menaquinone biosynthesis C-methylase UbiE
VNIKDYWDEQARTHKDGIEATTPDRYLRELEINAINDRLNDYGSMLDIGCGNGYSTIRFKEKHPNLDVTGMDFSAEMLSYAPQDIGITWKQGDVRHTGYPDACFDQVTTDRCLINLEATKEQVRALFEIHRILKPGGTYLMCENWFSGLTDLNKFRVTLDLKPIEVRWHNRYLDDEFKLWMDRLFQRQSVIPFASTYYLCSRVIAARLAADLGQEPAYDNRVNEMAKSLPAMGDLGPMKLYVLRKP